MYEKLLPLGSIVVIEDIEKKLLIVSRQVEVEGQSYDYGVALYPEGLIDDTLLYLSKEAIQAVLHTGYRDEEEELYLSMLGEEEKEEETTTESSVEDLFAQLHEEFGE